MNLRNLAVSDVRKPYGTKQDIIFLHNCNCKDAPLIELTTQSINLLSSDLLLSTSLFLFSVHYYYFPSWVEYPVLASILPSQTVDECYDELVLETLHCVT